NLSLIPECFDWIERGGFARGIKTKKDSDRGAEHERDDDRAERNQRRPVRVTRQNLRRANPEDDSDHATDRTQRNRFDEKLSENVAAVRANGHAGADFTRPLG